MSETLWANRIIGYGEEAPDQLLANPLNARIHPKFQQDALHGVLNEVGWVQNIIVNKSSGCVIDGHLRVTLALRHAQPRVPVTYVDLTDAEEAEIIASLDPIAALAVYDAAKLDELLREVQTGDAAVQTMLAELAKEAGLVAAESQSPAEDVAIAPQWMVVVVCESEREQVALLERFVEEGLSCRALVS
jgi:ParB-like chromosome segregation protein Spo0J